MPPVWSSLHSLNLKPLITSIIRLSLPISQWLFRNQMKTYSSLVHPWFLHLKSFCLRSNIKHSTQFFITVMSSLDLFLHPAVQIYEIHIFIFSSSSSPVILRTSLVPRRFRLGQSWTLPWAVTSPRDTRREPPALSQTSRGQRGKRERLGTRLTTNQFNDQLPVDLLAHVVRALKRYFRGQCGFESRNYKPDFIRFLVQLHKLRF